MEFESKYDILLSIKHIWKMLSRIWQPFSWDFIMLKFTLTHWGWEKMAAVFQTTFSNGSSWMKMYEFWLLFHLSLFSGVQAVIWTNDGIVFWRIYVSLGLNELSVLCRMSFWGSKCGLCCMLLTAVLFTVFWNVGSYRWVSARKTYLQCFSDGVTYFLH